MFSCAKLGGTKRDVEIRAHSREKDDHILDSFGVDNSQWKKLIYWNSASFLLCHTYLQGHEFLRSSQFNSENSKNNRIGLISFDGLHYLGYCWVGPYSKGQSKLVVYCFISFGCFVHISSYWWLQRKRGTKHDNLRKIKWYWAWRLLKEIVRIEWEWNIKERVDNVGSTIIIQDIIQDIAFKRIAKRKWLWTIRDTESISCHSFLLAKTRMDRDSHLHISVYSGMGLFSALDISVGYGLNWNNIE